MTVNMLIQIDKLVQLLESPVFTCMLPHLILEYLSLTLNRPPASTSGTGEVSAPIQVPLWASHATSTVISLCRIEK